jgi:hypothetical protein
MHDNDDENIKNLDAYIDSVAIKDFKPNMLFILADSHGADVKCIYQNPFEIIRDFWHEHSKWAASFDQVYVDTLAYLHGKANELHYGFSARYFQQLLSAPDNVTLDDINNVSFLFLVQHSVLCPNLLFGYAYMPEQTELLKQMLESSGFIKTDNLVRRILAKADHRVCATIRAEVATRTTANKVQFLDFD